MASFIAGEIVAMQQKLFEKLEKLLSDNDYSEKVDVLRERWSKLGNTDKIKVAFVGQYSAGKSSIISALTGKKLAIGTDVTTEESTDYEWGNFLLTDTPGLQNNNIHDAIANEAIKNADLIVYCITYELFNRNTLTDYLELAYEKGYINKMILVINKINSEETENRDELIANYVESLNKTLFPHSLNEIAHCFIDVLDYLKGVEKNRETRIQKSNFEQFIDILNTFLSDNGLTCKLDTPLRVASDIIAEVMIDESESDEEKQKNIILTRMDRDIKRLRSEAERKWKNEVNKGLSFFSDKAYCLFENIQSGECKDPEISYNTLLTETLEDINCTLTRLSQEYEDECEALSGEVLKSRIGKKLFEGINVDSVCTDCLNGIKGHKETNSAVKDKVGSLGKKAAQAGGKVTEEGAKKVILKIGHKLGHKFKPWEAAKLAGKATKALKLLGPALEVVNIVSDIKETVDEDKELKDQQRLRNDLYVMLEDSKKELRLSSEEQWIEFVSEVFNTRLDEISNVKKKISESKDADKAFNTELSAIESEIGKIQEILFG